jgi:hypothetical protein
MDKNALNHGLQVNYEIIAILNIVSVACQSIRDFITEAS